MKSPLRYPGGKTRAITQLTDILNKYYPNINSIISPFCGGCSFEFSFQNIPVKCYDIFIPLIIFWNVCKTDKNKLIEKLKSKIGKITKEKFIKYKNLLNNNKQITNKQINDLKIAMYYFIVNRCSFSGSTCSGGFSQESMLKRFTINSIKNIENLNLDLYEFGCNDFSEVFDIIEDEFIFCDPPYLLKSKLYGINGDLHESFNHKLLHNKITKINNNWIITYNDCEYIRDLYKNYMIIPLNWKYGMNKTKNSSEIVILSLKQGTIPHLLGLTFELKVLQFFKELGYKTSEKTANNKSGPDLLIFKNNDNIKIECKTNIIGVDYKQIKLEYKNNKYRCNIKESEYMQNIINKYITNLFDNEYPPIDNISSVDWNNYKKNTGKFKDIHIDITDNISEILYEFIQCDYIIFKDYGIYKLRDIDLLNFNCPKFYSTNFEFRFYIKNHSSSTAKKANLSIVATLRLKNKQDIAKSNIQIE